MVLRAELLHFSRRLVMHCLMTSGSDCGLHMQASCCRYCRHQAFGLTLAPCLQALDFELRHTHVKHAISTEAASAHLSPAVFHEVHQWLQRVVRHRPQLWAF